MTALTDPDGFDIRELHLVTAAGHDRTLTVGHDDGLPIWTPDGQHLVFEHHRAGATVHSMHSLPVNPYVISTLPGSKPHALTVSERRHWFP